MKVKLIRYPLPKEMVEKIEIERNKFIKNTNMKISQPNFVKIGIKFIPVWEKRLKNVKTKK